MKIFDPLQIPIKGINLIEASAGTGKTYSISALFARLIILENLEIEKILIVTFTKDATAELKIRLRSNLLNILDCINNNSKSEDYFINNLINTLDNNQRKKAILKIKQTLNNFDNASIFTIHGFCLKILKNYPHLCNYPNQININENGIYDKILQITHDFWRKNILNNKQIIDLFFDKKIETMLNNINKYLNKPYIKYNKPQVSIKDLQQINNEITQQLQDVQQNITYIKQSFNEIKNYINKIKFQKIEELFTDIGKNQLNNKETIKKLKSFNEKNIIDNLNKKFKEINIPNEIFNNLNKLYSLGLSLQKKQNLVNDIIVLMEFNLLEYINLELNKTQNNDKTYDDLLVDLYSCINQNDSNCQILINILKNNWQIVLIDEFQDTDKLQYEIFKKIFIDNKITTFLVGDPKQSIYKFRGADVFTYLNSIKYIDHIYTLNINYRSNEHMVNTINFLFNQRQLPFVLENINYTKINAYKKSRDFLPLEADINIISCDDIQDKNTEDTKKAIAKKCALTIQYLLNKYNNLKASDIAVLVSQHKEAALINSALKELKINSSTIQKESIFNCEEAQAIISMLELWLNPQNINNLSFLLTSCIFNYNENEINDIINHNDKLDNIQQIAKTTKNILVEKGFYNAFNFFDNKFNIFTNLLALDRQRTITNINHLIEILSQQELINGNYHLTIEWFKNNLQQHQYDKTYHKHNKYSNDEYLLKLENDDLLLTIITNHAVKGLQYEIVFCPFLWNLSSKSNGKNDSFNTINKNNEIKLVPNTQINNEDTKIINDENLSEKLRLIYVALTRAKEKLYIYLYNKDLSKNHKVEDSAFKYLFENYITNSNYSWETWKNWHHKIGSPDYIKLSEDIPNYNIAYTENYNKNEATKDLKSPLSFTRKHLHSIKQTSFSFMIKSMPNNLNGDYDKNDLIVDTPEIEPSIQNDLKNQDSSQVTDIFTFPKGIKTGLCWHAILEKFNFAQDAQYQIDLIKQQLLFYGLKDNNLLEITINMLNKVRKCKLNYNTQLYKIQDYSPEIKFTLKINNLDFNIIKQWLSKQYIFKDTNIKEYIKMLNFKSIECFLEGFIDLVFMDIEKNLYLIDYKSNYLGNTIQDYNLTNLTNSMLKNHYYLQAVIYSLSLFRYLLYNQFEFKNIKIRYIYLRGLDDETQGNGIWSWDLEKKDLNNINNELSLINK